MAILLRTRRIIKQTYRRRHHHHTRDFEDVALDNAVSTMATRLRYIPSEFNTKLKRIKQNRNNTICTLTQNNTYILCTLYIHLLPTSRFLACTRTTAPIQRCVASLQNVLRWPCRVILQTRMSERVYSGKYIGCWAEPTHAVVATLRGINREQGG